MATDISQGEADQTPTDAETQPEFDVAATLLEGQEVDEAVTETPAPDMPEVGQVTTDQVPAEVTTETEPAPPTFLEQLGELGFQDLQDESDARARLLDAFRENAEQLEQQRAQAAQLQQLAQYGNLYLQQQQAPPQPTPEPEDNGKPAPKWWEPPQVDQTSLQRYRVAGADGNWTWKEDTPAEIRAAAQQYEAYVTNWVDRLSYEPEKALPPAVAGIIASDQSVQEHINRLVDERVQAQIQNTFAERESQEFTDRIVEENKDWLFAKDPRTNQIAYDNGNPVWSQEGREVERYIDQGRELGITDPRHLWKFAIDQHELAKVRRERQSQATAGQVEQQQMNHLRRGAGSIPDRSGSLPKNPQDPGIRPQNPNLTPGQQVAEAMRAEGLL